MAAPALKIQYERPKLYPKQREAIFDPLDYQGNPARFSLIEASTKAGKAQPLDSFVYTPVGPKLMGDVRTGDIVLTPAGTAPVVGVYPQGERDIYRVTFSDGSSCEADGEHLWEVHYHRQKPVVVTTKDLMAWPKWKFSRAWVPAIEPAQFAECAVPLDPYLVGALIGDGALAGETIRFASDDAEIVDEIVRALPPDHVVVKEKNHDWRITVAGNAAQHREDKTHIAGSLTRLGLRCLSHEKSIPWVYRYNSVDVRRAVLQGILDTDGFVDKHGQPAIEQTSQRLAEDITALVQSLGGTVLTRYREVNGYRNADGDFVQCRPVWRQVIRFADASWCFRLPRKRSAVRPKAKTGNRIFESIVFSRRTQAQCIAIDDPRHLYLTDNFIPTHNTAGCTAWLFEQAIFGKRGENHQWIAPVYGQAKIAFRRIKRGIAANIRQSSSLADEPANASPFTFHKPNESELFIELFNGSTLWFKSAEKPDNLYGEDVHSAVLDEASRMREESWHAVRSTLTATRGKARMIGNVKGRANWFYKMARKAQQGSRGLSFHRITAFDAVAAGVLDMEEIEEARARLPENVFRELYMAEASEDDTNPFGYAHIEACILPVISDEPPVVIGVDLAKSSDWTVVVALDRSMRVCGFERWQAPWTETKARLASIIGRTPALVDSTGVGDPVVEDLQTVLPYVEGFKFSATSKQRLMELLVVEVQQHRIRFPDGHIKQELECFEYEVTRTGTRYTAPDGYHDDCVMALALAAMKYREKFPVLLHTATPAEIIRVSPWTGAHTFGD
ncbi:MAG: hypothetical protein E6R03_04190 [Hyphomicrobiaceae bacterium]|nr:MAG: hypothetical protein E6R03_04190 [Hyphomicrobiaceae bacterium]